MLFSFLGEDRRRSALQNILSHASDMHICLHVSVETFFDVFGFNERDPGATNAIGAAMTHFNTIVQIEFLLIFTIHRFIVQTTART